MSSTVVVSTRVGEARLERLLNSLAAQTQPVWTIVFDNAAPGDVAGLVARHGFGEHLRLDRPVRRRRLRRAAFSRVGGFDGRLFAYWEDIDLVLHLLGAQRTQALARARGPHEHSATLGSGSQEKNYLTGFGRGYVLRKWSVLESPPRLARAPRRRNDLRCAGALPPHPRRRPGNRAATRVAPGPA